MKLKDGYILRKIAKTDIIVPIGNNIADFNGIISLNETAAFICNLLKEEISKGDLVSKLMEEFEVDEDLARNDIDDFIIKLAEHKMIVGV